MRRLTCVKTVVAGLVWSRHCSSGLCHSSGRLLRKNTRQRID